MDREELVEAAENLLDCGCGHSLASHNSVGCYAKLYTDPPTRCPCPLGDDRSPAELLATNLSAVFERLAALEREAGDMEVELHEQLRARERLTETVGRVEGFYRDMDSLPHYAESGGFRILDEVDLDELKDDLRHAIDGTTHPRAARTVRRARRATRREK